MSMRRVVSLTALLAFAVMAYTGLMLFIGPQGRVAYWSGWTLFGLGKEEYGELHTTFMTLFLVAIVWHTVLNWKVILHYLRNRARRIRVFTPEFTIALTLMLAFLLGTLFRITPFQEYLAFGEGIKEYWEETNGSPPWGHAEENSLDRFTRGLVDWERLENQRTVSFETPTVMAALRAEGYEVLDEKQRLIEIAKANDTTPQALMSVLLTTARPLESPAEAHAPGYPRPVSGLGKMSLRQYAEKYGVDLSLLRQTLEEKGLEVDPDRKLRSEAERWNLDPDGLLEIAWES